jgi:hypothetical protein
MQLVLYSIAARQAGTKEASYREEEKEGGQVQARPGRCRRLIAMMSFVFSDRPRARVVRTLFDRVCPYIIIRVYA